MTRLLRHPGEKLPRRLKKAWRKRILRNFQEVNGSRASRIHLFYSPVHGWTSEYIPSRHELKRR